jgi:hypothetical protein
MEEQIQLPETNLEYDRVMRMTPQEKAAAFSDQLVMRPEFDEAERDAGMANNANRVVERDMNEILRAQGQTPRRGM